MIATATTVPSQTPSAVPVLPQSTHLVGQGVPRTATPIQPTPTATLVPSATPTPLPLTSTPTATPWPTSTATPTPTALPADLWLGPTDLRIHPDGDAFYSGDLISFQIYAHHGHEWISSAPPDVDVEIWLGRPGQDELIADGRALFYGGRDGEARLDWVWDTTGIEGKQTLSVLLDPDDEIRVGDEDPGNNLITRTVDLRSSSELPAVWAEARWVQRASACCVFHYISGGAAERDIGELMALADEAISYAGAQLGEETDVNSLDVYLIDRVLGHGGFAGDGVIVSYLDRFYAGGAWAQVFRHEGTHAIDRRFAEIRPALLAEGLAVFVAGGHFRKEPITERAAAVLALDRYIPLSDLADDFYRSQHEIGYLEAAGFVSFLIDRFGWVAFKAFYSDIQSDEDGQAATIDVALQDRFGLTLSQAEDDWLDTLRARSVSAAEKTDLSLTVAFYETVRRYQRLWDPSAYFLEPWWPVPEEAERRGIIADLMRHPTRPVNVTLETMFVAADRAIDDEAYAQAEVLLDAINAVLNAGGDLEVDPLADQFRALVQVTAAAGYQAQQIELDLENSVAHVLAAQEHEATTVQLTFFRRGGNWRMALWGD